MSEIEIEVDKELEKAQKKEAEDNKKVSFVLKNEIFDGSHNHIIEKIPFETTKKGLEEFKRLLDPKKDEREAVLLEELIEEMDNLTFYDGVILVWEIFDRIVDEYFDEDDKDSFGHRYDLGLIDKMQNVLSNEVLNKIENLRKEHLHELFILKSDLYKRPAWMRKKV